MKMNKINIELPEILQEEFENLCIKHPHVSREDMLVSIIRLGICTNTILSEKNENLKQVYLYLMLSDHIEDDIVWMQSAIEKRQQKDT